MNARYNIYLFIIISCVPASTRLWMWNVCGCLRDLFMFIWIELEHVEVAQLSITLQIANLLILWLIFFCSTFLLCFRSWKNFADFVQRGRRRNVVEIVWIVCLDSEQLWITCDAIVGRSVGHTFCIRHHLLRQWCAGTQSTLTIFAQEIWTVSYIRFWFVTHKINANHFVLFRRMRYAVHQETSSTLNYGIAICGGVATALFLYFWGCEQLHITSDRLISSDPQRCLSEQTKQNQSRFRIHFIFSFKYLF